MQPTPEQIEAVKASTKRTVMTWGGHGVVFTRPNGIDGTYVDSADCKHFRMGCADTIICVYLPDGSCLEGEEAKELVFKLEPRDLGDPPQPPPERYDFLDCHYH